MSTKGNNAHKKFVNQIIEFNKCIPTDAPAMTKAQRNRVVEKWTEGMETTSTKKKIYEKKKRIKKAKAAKRKFIGRITALGLAAVAAFPVGKIAYDEYTEYQQQNSPITLDMALEHGETPNSLGIDNDTLLEIEEIEKILEKENLTNQDIIALALKINSAYFDTVKGKLADTLGVQKEEIKIYTEPAEEGTTMETVKVKNGNTYINKDIFTYKNSISKEISDSIKSIGEMQDIMEKIRKESSDKDEIIEELENKAKEISQIAAMKMNIDENGNISADVTKEKDLNDKTNQIKTASIDEGPEL